jgi:hypothetical protein
VLDFFRLLPARSCLFLITLPYAIPNALPHFQPNFIKAEQAGAEIVRKLK